MAYPLDLVQSDYIPKDEKLTAVAELSNPQSY